MKERTWWPAPTARRPPPESRSRAPRQGRHRGHATRMPDGPRADTTRCRSWCHFGAGLFTDAYGRSRAPEEDLPYLQGFLRLASDGYGSLRRLSSNSKTVDGRELVRGFESPPLRHLQLFCVVERFSPASHDGLLNAFGALLAHAERRHRLCVLKPASPVSLRAARRPSVSICRGASLQTGLRPRETGSHPR